MSGQSIAFATAGNDNAELLSFNLKRLSKIHADSPVAIFDWGYKQSHLRQFHKANPRVRIIDWPQAHVGNLMREKVACIHRWYEISESKKVVFHDTDIIFVEGIDEVFDDEGWDVAATWRPEHEYRKSEFGVGAWLNAGVVFLNSANPDATQAFLTEWLARCDRWVDQSWWLDQVELIKLFAQAEPDLSEEVGRIGRLAIDGLNVRCRTLPYQVYNFLPEMYEPYTDYRIGSAKVVHLKSPWRKTKFRLMSPGLRETWLEWQRNDYGGSDILYRLNHFASSLIRLWLTLAHYGRELVKRTKTRLDPRVQTEVYYWESKARKVGDLYAHESRRMNSYLDLFDTLLPIPRNGINRVADVGAGPIGGIVDFVDADEKWVIDPEIHGYREAGVWLPKSEVIIRETVAEELEGVPEEHFDCVFTMNAIDHGYDIEAAILKLYECLKVDGLLYLHVHCRTPAELNRLHRQAYSPRDLHRWLADVGFSEVASRVFEEDPIPTNKYKTFVGVFRKPKS